MMTTNLAVSAPNSVVIHVLVPAVRALLLAIAVGLVMAALRVRSTTLRLIAWTAVLYAGLGMPLLSWVLPSVSVSAPQFLNETAVVQLNEVKTQAASPISPSRAIRREPNRAPQTTGIQMVSVGGTIAPQFAVHTSAQPPIAWGTVAAGLYVAVTLLLLARLTVGIIFSRRLIRSSQAIRDQGVVQSLVYHSRSCGARKVPHIAESELISVPVTMSIVRPCILLPTSWREWDEARLNAVLAHEVSHVARRDALTQRLSLVHRAIFWFSPLAWWLHGHLANLAEQASDEAALSCGADRTDYARTLLGFFEALHATTGRVWWQGVSMATAGQAEQRLERILAWKGAVTMGLRKSVLVAVIALSLPVLYLAASVRPANASLQESAPAQTPPPAPQAATAPTAPPASGEPAIAPVPPNSAIVPPAPATSNGIVLSGGRLWIAPVAPTAPVAAVAPVPPVAPWPYQSSGNSHAHYSYGYGRSYSHYSDGYDDDERFVIVSGSSDAMTMSGSTEDARHAQKLKKQIVGDFIWFERDEKSYIIRDQATIDQARKLWAPQEELGKKQEELGKQQEALGKQQEELGKKMEQVQVKVPDMTAELDRLKAKLQKLGPNATMEQLGDLQSEIGDLQSKIGEVQSQAGEQQSKLGEQMGALGEKQGKLGEEQGKLGEQQGELAEQASRQMKELLGEAIKSGKAQPEAQTGGTGML